MGVEGVPEAARERAAWPDLPLPALGGMAPRVAARRRGGKVRAALDLVLRDIENHEARQPEAERYDASSLWALLGLPR